MITSPNPTPVVATRPILRDVTTRPWAVGVKVGDSTLGTVAGRALQFAFEGAGDPSERRIVPQSPAAARLLEGASGAAVEQALRGIAATTDDFRDQTSFRGITLARSYRDFQVNSAINYLERGDVPGWRAAGGSKARAALDEALDSGRQVSQMAVAQAPDWVNLGPFATRQLLRLAGMADAGERDAKVGAWIASLAAHEPHHTVTPPRMKDIIRNEYLQRPLPPELEKRSKEDPFVAMKPLNWLEEGTADVLSTWAGTLSAAGSRLGIPTLDSLPEPMMPDDDVMEALQGRGAGGRFTPEGRTALDRFAKEQFGIKPRSDGDRMQMAAMALTGMRNYPTHVEGLQRLLMLAGLDPADADDAAAASQLLQGSRIDRVPGRIADAIIEHRKVDPDQREQLRTAIRDAGTHVMSDPAEFDAAIARIEQLVA